jgi:hypothetical protein
LEVRVEKLFRNRPILNGDLLMDGRVMMGKQLVHGQDRLVDV